MATYIPLEVVTDTWQRMAQASPEQAPALINQMRQTQPAAMTYLLTLSEEHFDQYEGELLFYLGLVVWQIMQHGAQKPGQVTEARLAQVVNANTELLELLETNTEADFSSAVERMLLTYPEPEVLRYVVEAINEDDSLDNPTFTEDNRGLAFLILKNILDALIESRNEETGG